MEPRYQMVQVRAGHVVIEHDVLGQGFRAWFSEEAVAPKEEYREGDRIWRYSTSAQSFRFDVRDRESDEIVSFRELLGLSYFACARPGSALHTLGTIAQQNRIEVYVALVYEKPDGSPQTLAPQKVAVLNKLFNERLRTPGKKILILPDLFDLYRSMSYGDVLIDFGLTALEPAGARPEGLPTPQESSR